VIVEFDELPRYRGRVAMVGGGFDPLHNGHIEYFRAAHQLGLPVLCNVASDRYVATKHAPILSEGQRAAVIDAIRYIALTHIDRRGTAAVLRQLRPKYFVKGKDWEGRLPEDEVRACRELAVEVVYVDTVLDSSSRIIRQYLSSQAPGLPSATPAEG
jgi:cytidyltransferase-like protein